MCKLPVDLRNGFEREWPACLQPGVELLGPQGVHPASGECPADQGPVSVHEAEHALDGNVVVGKAAHDVDLPEYSVDELGAVAGSYEQALDPWPNEAALDLELRTALVLLGVDDRCRWE